MNARSVVLVHRSGRFQTSVRPDGQTGHGAAAIVGRQHHLPGMIDTDIARSRTSAGLLIEQIELSGFRLNRVGTDEAAFLLPELGNFADGIQQRPPGMQGKERRIRDFRDHRGFREASAGEVELEEVDPGLGRLRVGADIDPKHAALGLGLLRRHGNREGPIVAQHQAEQEQNKRSSNEGMAESSRCRLGAGVRTEWTLRVSAL